MLSAGICFKNTIPCQLIAYLYSRVNRVSTHFCTHSKRSVVAVLIGHWVVYSVRREAGPHPPLEVQQLYQTDPLLYPHPLALNRHLAMT
jgi:hypothetical protein